MAFMLSEDLVAVRKFRKLTVRDIYDATRIPLEVIEEIESGYVFTPECHRNKTYVRSFVRTYAKALRISEADATLALDLSEKEAYDGFIRRGYLPGSDAAAPVVEKPIVASTPKAEPRITAERASSMMDYKDEVSRPDPTRPHNRATPPPPDVKSINWVDLGGKFSPFSQANKMVWAFVAGVAAILIVGYASVQLFGNNDEKDSVDPVVENPIPAMVDSTLVAPGDSTVIQPKIVETLPPPTLPDTVKLLIFASGDKLEGIRIRTEPTGMISQYWIEKGQAMEFTFRESFYVKSQLNRLSILFNGHLVDNLQSIKKTDGAIILDRAFFESRPEWLEPRPLDSLAVKPSKIVPRPVFVKKN